MTWFREFIGTSTDHIAIFKDDRLLSGGSIWKQSHAAQLFEADRLQASAQCGPDMINTTTLLTSYACSLTISSSLLFVTVRWDSRHLSHGPLEVLKPTRAGFARPNYNTICRFIVGERNVS